MYILYKTGSFHFSVSDRCEQMCFRIARSLSSSAILHWCVCVFIHNLFSCTTYTVRMYSCTVHYTVLCWVFVAGSLVISTERGVGAKVIIRITALCCWVSALIYFYIVFVYYIVFEISAVGNEEASRWGGPEGQRG